MDKRRIDVLGVQVNKIGRDDLLREISDRVESDSHSLILNVNVHCLNLAYTRAWLRRYLNESEIVFCDGVGVMLGARLLGDRIPERITYADLVWDLAEVAESRGFSVFLLGSPPGIAERAARVLGERYPRLRIVGTHHGFFDKTPGAEENDRVVREINRVRPNLLLVGMGMPIQERWLSENWERIDANLALTLGATLDFVAGSLKLPPRWLRDNGLQWLGRLFLQPRHLWRRYLIGNPQFIWRVLRQRGGRPA